MVHHAMIMDKPISTIAIIRVGCPSTARCGAGTALEETTEPKNVFLAKRDSGDGAESEVLLAS